LSAPLFFADADRLRACAVGDVVDLDGPEGHHAATVRRLTVGEKLDLADGDGLLCSAEVAAVVGRALRARVLARTQLERPQPRVTVVQALAKGDRDERAVEALTEVGVDAVVPAFLIIVLGGVGSFAGAVLASLLVGLTVGLTGAYASEWSLLSMYLLLVAVVTFRARGLFGKKSVLEA